MGCNSIPFVSKETAMRMSVVRISLLILLLAAALGAGPAPAEDAESSDAPEAERIQVGDEAPDFALPDLDGEIHRLADLRGVKPLVLVFFRGAW
jgi:cytochrome oxidase Cu insertion factor (SCO1/SenC/PrrC family)